VADAVPCVREAADATEIRVNITMRSRYGVRGLVGLARLSAAASGAPVRVGEVAAAREIPEPFLERLFLSLKRAGILRSHRGVLGGFSFARPPEEITVLDVVETLDGAIAIADCTTGDCERFDDCGPATVWTGLTDLVREHLDAISIAALVEIERRAAASPLSFEI
jgi:Rrf2 family protein